MHKYSTIYFCIEWMNEWKCSDVKCVQKPTRSRLSLTDHACKQIQPLKQSKIIRWSESPWNQSGRKEKGLWRKRFAEEPSLEFAWCLISFSSVWSYISTGWLKKSKLLYCVNSLLFLSHPVHSLHCLLLPIAHVLYCVIFFLWPQGWINTTITTTWQMVRNLCSTDWHSAKCSSRDGRQCPAAASVLYQTLLTCHATAPVINANVSCKVAASGWAGRLCGRTNARHFWI